MKNHLKIIIWSLVLIVVDLGIKFIIQEYYMDTRFDILPPWFYFQTTYNTHYFYLGSIMGWQVPLWAVLIFSLCLLGLNFYLYKWYLRFFNNSKWVKVAFVFAFSGVICAILSNVLFPGCLDYIYFKPYYIFDLKDVYLNLFWIFLIIAYLFNRKNAKSSN